MPILHVPYAADRGEDDGADSIQPSGALRLRGPCVQVSIALLQSMAQALLRQGVAVPTPVSGYGLVDTGASRTCIDETTAKQMGLPLVDRVSIASASHSSTLRNVYPVTVEIVGLPHQIHALHAVGAALRSQGLVALLGRDVLESCTLFYNGVSGEITISV